MCFCEACLPEHGRRHEPKKNILYLQQPFWHFVLRGNQNQCTYTLRVFNGIVEGQHTAQRESAEHQRLLQTIAEPGKSMIKRRIDGLFCGYQLCQVGTDTAFWRPQQVQNRLPTGCCLAQAVYVHLPHGPASSSRASTRKLTGRNPSLQESIADFGFFIQPS